MHSLPIKSALNRTYTYKYAIFTALVKKFSTWYMLCGEIRWKLVIHTDTKRTCCDVCFIHVSILLSGLSEKMVTNTCFIDIKTKAKRKKGIGTVTAAKSQRNETLCCWWQKTLLKGCSTKAATDKGQTREERCASQNQMCVAILLLFLSNKFVLIHRTPSSFEKGKMSSISTWLWLGNLNHCRQCTGNQCLWYKGVCDSGHRKV